MISSTFLTGVIGSYFENIDKFTFLKWGFYFAETYTCAQVFATISERLKFRVADKTYCWAYGGISRCNYGIQMSFLGLLASMYTLCMSVFGFYMELPEIMVFREIDLWAWRFGLWFYTSRRLDRWFKSHFLTRYGHANGHPKDKIAKIERMNSLIGNDIRWVRKMEIYVQIFLLLSLLMIYYEDREKQKKTDQN